MVTDFNDRVIRNATGELDPESLAPIRDAFKLFDRQSRLLRTAYQSLKRDLAHSNQELQCRNQDLTVKIQELHQMSGRLESVLESMTDGLLVVGLDRRIERCNSSVATMLNRRRDELDGAFFSEVIALNEADEGLTDVLNGGAAVLDRAWRIADPEGGERLLLVSIASVTDSDGRILGAICNVRNVTELHRLQKTVQSHERLAALGEMAASVAHEIRNPLGTIEGFARLLRRDLADLPRHLRLAEKIVEGTQNLNYVITNLLTYARPMQLQVATVSLAGLFERCREILSDRAAQAGVTLVLRKPPRGLTVSGDERQLTQVLLNLGINAVEACRSGGHVCITAQAGRLAVAIRVSDDGCGMDAAVIERVFDPFFTRKEGGTGLGLSLTRKIVDAHGGEISATSQPGMGSVFTVALPPRGVVK